MKYALSAVIVFLPAGCVLPSAWLVLRLLYVFSFVCVCVCVRPQSSHALSYFITLLCHYSHECTGCYWGFAGLVGQGSLVLCCLDGERVVGNDDNFICASSDH